MGVVVGRAALRLPALSASSLLLLLLVCVGGAGGYTDPVVTPARVTDQYGNLANEASYIEWADIPSSAGNYSPAIDYEENPAVAGFMGMVRGFTHILQPNDPDYEMIAGLIAGTTDIGSIATDLALYFIGFAICFVLGLFFTIIMPIVGCCFCCCRLCGKCGGRMYQKHPDERLRCKCVALTIALAIVVAVMFTGAAMVYFMNDRMGFAIKNVGTATTGNLNDMKTYMKNTVGEMNYLVGDGYGFASKVVKRDLDNIDAILGVNVKIAMNKQAGVAKVMQDIIDMDDSIDVSTTDMEATKTLQDEYEPLVAAINTDLGNIKTTLDGLKGDAGCDASCQALDTSSMVAGIDPTTLPTLTWRLVLMYDLQARDLSATAIEGKKDFDTIPEKIKNDTATSVADTKDLLDQFADTAKNGISAVDGLAGAGVDDMIDSQLGSLTTYTDMIVEYDTYRSYGFWGLCGFIMFIGLFFLIGMLLGCCGFRKDTKPTQRSGVSNCGGCCLMAGAGFVFIFSWLLMLLVTLPFLLGAPLDRFFCQTFADPQNTVFTEFLDKPDGLFGPGYFLAGLLLQDSSKPLTFGGVLQACKDQQAAYTALQLSSMFNLTEVTGYRESIDIESTLDGMQSDMSNIEVLSDDTRQMLLDFKDATSIDFTKYDELAKDFGKTSFDDLATAVRNAGNDMANSASVRTSLLAEADKLDAIVDTDVPEAEAKKVELIAAADDMETSSKGVPAAVDTALSSAQQAEDAVQRDGTQIVNDEVKVYAERILTTMDKFVNFTVNAVKTEVGVCTPIWNLWDSLINNALCNYLILSLNGFWFSLGWAVFFMVPSLILGVKLAKYLRKMKHENEDTFSTPASPIDKKNSVAPMNSQMPGGKKGAAAAATTNPMYSSRAMEDGFVHVTPPPAYNSGPPSSTKTTTVSPKAEKYEAAKSATGSTPPDAAAPAAAAPAATATAATAAAATAATAPPMEESWVDEPVVIEREPTFHHEGVHIKTLRPGDGTHYPRPGDTVRVKYTGRLGSAWGPVFDATNGAEPLEFKVGRGQVIKGWDVAFLQLSREQKARLTLKPEYAYGSAGAGDAIPPNSTLVFDVELVDIKVRVNDWN